MFMPYFVDGAGRRHTFQDDFALKGGLLKALRKGEDVFFLSVPFEVQLFRRP